uniref:Putative conserved secreted protein n=1 Tax=Ixodes ricinus TaxID=34613 RepID=A0A6B0UMJ3_IXORI
MCRNLSNMLFVLFAVALILPALLEAAAGILDCGSSFYPLGDIYCQLSGHEKSEGLNYRTCELECGGSKVQLPKEACPNGTRLGPCSEELSRTLTKWYAGMRKRKGDLLKKWCANALEE